MKPSFYSQPDMQRTDIVSGLQEPIETVAGMTPKELTAMFEVMSGSDACKHISSRVCEQQKG